MIIRADQVASCNALIRMHLSAERVKDTRFWFWHTSNPFLRFYRMRRDDSIPVLVHETECVKNNLNPVWLPIEVKA
jgi:hypothetical protein